jgi:cytochrome c peroxidase
MIYRMPPILGLVKNKLRRRVICVCGWVLVSCFVHANGQAQDLNNNQTITATHRKEPLVQLGRKLFLDTRLSRDGTVSCASCHQSDRAFTDGKPRAEGVQGQTGTRNTPSLYNAAYTDAKFWDGRRPNLTEQVLDPFINPREQGLADHTELLQKFRAAKDYKALFQNAFKRPLAHAAATDIASALSAYINDLKPQHTRLERYLSGNQAEFNAAEQQGLELFRGRAHCADCHHLGTHAAPLTDGDYHTRGIGLSQLSSRLAKLTKALAVKALPDRERAIGEDPDIAALGRFVVTLHPSDLGQFKTPSLYSVALTAPYMHDGSIATLEEAVDWELYFQGQESRQPIVLSQAERANLLAFLRALIPLPAQVSPSHVPNTKSKENTGEIYTQ